MKALILIVVLLSIGFAISALGGLAVVKLEDWYVGRRGRGSR